MKLASLMLCLPCCAGTRTKGIMKTNLTLIAMCVLTCQLKAQIPDELQSFAYDNADLNNYAPQPNNSWPAINGGYGYGTWTPLGGISGGSTYMDGTNVYQRQVDGSYSFAFRAGGTPGSNSGYAISRPLSDSLIRGEFDITTRFDINGDGTNLVNLRTGNNTANLESGELLSFGIKNGNELGYNDMEGYHVIASGESRGPIWHWTVAFDAAVGVYTLWVTNTDGADGGFAYVTSGSLEASGMTVGSFAVINSSAGTNQNIIFDSPAFVIQQPAASELTGVPWPGSHSGLFQLSFSNLSGTPFTVLASTNAALPMNAWSNIGAAVESPAGSGQFQFTDPQTTNNLQRFYRVRTP